MKRIRSPICTVLGHVDHGKSTLLDNIRGTAIVNSEPGAITQAIGASIIPLETIKKIAKNQLNKYRINIDIPGILFIDTPGHAAFTNLRKRGGNLADIAILVIDINEGAKEQTLEALEILRKYKTPFVVAANKIDKIHGWTYKKDDLIENINSQRNDVIERFETKLYQIVGWLSEHGFNSERFDRVSDFTKEIAIVPVSAVTGEGIPELLLLVMALVQKYLKDKMYFDDNSEARGTILEIKKVKGNLTAADVILYEGVLRKGDEIVVGTLDEPIVTKVRGLFMPKPLSEIRDEKSEFKSVEEVVAAIGVRIIAKDLEKAVAGMPIISNKGQKSLEKIKEEIKESIEEVIIDTSNEGIIVKADSLGSLEAVVHLLEQHDIEIRKASIGNITKKDLIDAASNENPENRIILGFNVELPKELENDVKTMNIPVILEQIIYRLIERLEMLQEQIRNEEQLKALSQITYPFKIKVLRGYIFRQSNPAIVGVEVLGGKLKPGQVVMNDNGKVIGVIKSIQKDKEFIHEANRNDKVAVSITNAIYGRHFFEDDILYSEISEEHFRKLKELKRYLSEDAVQILKEIAEIKRKDNPLWGV